MASVKMQTTIVGVQPPSGNLIQQLFGWLDARQRFVIGSTVGLVLAALTIWQVSNAYNSAYKLFEGVVLSSSVKVNAAEKAIQHIANVNKYAADYIASFDDLSKRSNAYINLQLDFAKFRDQLFILREGLRDFQDTREFLAAEQKVYEKYWGNINTLLVARQRGDILTALATYDKADDLLENSITPTLHKIEKLNFEAMVADKAQATSIIYSQLLVLAVVGIGLATLLTFISFWLRFKVKRYLSPGTDIAALLAWVFAAIMIAQLIALPDQLDIMVEDAYYSISGVSRVLAVANQADRTESAALNDPANAKKWQDKFDTYLHKLELLMCGQPGCMQVSFSSAANTDVGNSVLIHSAHNITPGNAETIDNVTPLLANLTFPGEVRALEKARIAYNEYLQYNAQMRLLLQANNLTGVFNLNSGVSTEAFTKFVQAMEEERIINQEMFDSVWERQKSALSSVPLQIGIAGYTLVILLIIVGLLHRYREL